MSVDIERCAGGVRGARAACAGAGIAMPRMRAGAAVIVLAIAAMPVRAGSMTAMPTGTATATPGVLALHGRIVDASRDPAVGVAGAQVEVDVAGVGVVATLHTDATGAFDLTLSVADDDWVVFEVTADGFLATGRGYTGVELRPRPTILFRLQPRNVSAIRGRVFDVSNPSVGIAGAQVEYLRDQGRDTVVTDADGAFTLILELPENEYLGVWVTIEGYVPSLTTYAVADVRRAGAIDIGLQPASGRVDTEISGTVYDGSRGLAAPVADAEIDYISHNPDGAFADQSGTVHTAADGSYHFALPLAAHDYIEFTVSAAGYATWFSYVSASQTSAPVDFGLAPTGGIIDVEPPDMDVTCGGSFDVTVTNVAPPGEILVILQIDFGFDYGEGVYGTEFRWDLSSIQFPVQLASGEHIAFPVSFLPGGEFPSRLFITVVSGARDGSGAATYYGNSGGCHVCPGDCDGNGVVTIDELLQGVAMALFPYGPLNCPAADVDGSLNVSIDELVAAVTRALNGCAPPGE